jgi:hypothetical protein
MDRLGRVEVTDADRRRKEGRQRALMADRQVIIRELPLPLDFQLVVRMYQEKAHQRSGGLSSDGPIARCGKLVDFSPKARSFLVKCGDFVGDGLPLLRGNFLNKLGLFLAKR